MNASGKPKIKNKEKLYELNTYRSICIFSALFDVVYTLVAFIFFRGVQQFQQNDLKTYLYPSEHGMPEKVIIPCILRNDILFVQVGAYLNLTI